MTTTTTVRHRQQVVSNFVALELTGAPTITTGDGAWRPTHARVTVSTALTESSPHHVSITPDGPNEFGIKKFYTFGLPRGFQDSSADNSVTPDLLITDLPAQIITAIELAAGVRFADCAGT